MVIIFRLILSVIFVPLISIGSYADDKAQRIELISKHFRLQKPEGKGKFPVVMLVPGCHGFNFDTAKDHYDRAQDLLVELGFATLRIDSLAVRNAATCNEVGSGKVADDIYFVAEFLHDQNFVKKDALNVMGWSWGGACALQALKKTKNRKPANVNAVVAYYPSCWIISSWDSEIPVLAFFGAVDNITPFSDCESLIKNLSKPHKFTYRIYDNAHHQFDMANLPSKLKRYYGTVGYNEQAAESAWKEVSKFLKR